MEDEIPNRIMANSIKIQSISRKIAQNLPVFGVQVCQIEDFFGTRIVRVFGQKYSRFEYHKILE